MSSPCDLMGKGMPAPGEPPAVWADADLGDSVDEEQSREGKT